MNTMVDEDIFDTMYGSEIDERTFGDHHVLPTNTITDFNGIFIGIDANHYCYFFNTNTMEIIIKHNVSLNHIPIDNVIGKYGNCHNNRFQVIPNVVDVQQHLRKNAVPINPLFEQWFRASENLLFLNNTAQIIKIIYGKITDIIRVKNIIGTNINTYYRYKLMIQNPNASHKCVISAIYTPETRFVIGNHIYRFSGNPNPQLIDLLNNLTVYAVFVCHNNSNHGIYEGSNNIHYIRGSLVGVFDAEWVWKLSEICSKLERGIPFDELDLDCDILVNHLSVIEKLCEIKNISLPPSIQQIRDNQMVKTPDYKVLL